MSNLPTNWQKVGALLGPHGLQGWVKAKVTLDDPMLLVTAGPVRLSNGTLMNVLDVKAVGQGRLAVLLEGIATVHATMALRGQSMELDRNRWPADADEVYLDELQGLRVLNAAQDLQGTVRGTMDLPAGPALEIVCAQDGKVRLVPFLSEFLELAGPSDRRALVLTDLGLALLQL